MRVGETNLSDAVETNTNCLNRPIRHISATNDAGSFEIKVELSRLLTFFFF